MRPFFLSLFFTFIYAAVMAQDVTPPTANCKNITVQLDTWGYAAIAAQDLDDGSTDDDVIASFDASQTEFFCGDLFDNPHTVVLTVTDASGNASTCESAVTVEDNLPPANLNCLSFIADLQEDGTYYVNPFYLDGGSEEGCPADITSSKTDFTCEDLGDNYVTVTYIDLSGNVSTCEALIQVIDILPPSVVCQDITIELDQNGNAAITAADIDGGTYDNCSFLLEASQTAFDANNLGENTVTLTATDPSGNASACDAIVTVNPYPMAAVCQDINVTLANGNATISAQDVDGGSFGFENAEVSNSYFDCSSIGANEVTLTVSNGDATASCTAIVTVEGSTPTASIASANIPAGCQGDFKILTASSDDETSSFLWNNGQSGNTINAGNGIYSVLATNQYGCTAEAFQTVSFDKTTTVNAYTIIGTDAVSLKRSTINNGGVAVSKAGAKATFDRNSVVTASSSFVKAPIIDVKGGSIVTNKTVGQATLTLPKVLTNPFGSAKKLTNITVADNATVTLSDSIYGTISIGKNAKVTFTQPRIYAVSYLAKEASVVNFSGCADVILSKTALFDIKSKTNTNQNKVSFHISVNAGTDEFTFNAGAEFNGLALSPAGNIVVAKATAAIPTKLSGQFIAKTVTADEYTTWNWNTNCNSCEALPEAFSAPEIGARVAQPEASDEVKSVNNNVEMAAYPNPFNDYTTIRFRASTDGKAKLAIYNIAGQQVESLFEGNIESGSEYTFQFNGSNQPAGTYFYRLETNDKVYVNKIMLAR